MLSNTCNLLKILQIFLEITNIFGEALSLDLYNFTENLVEQANTSSSVCTETGDVSAVVGYTADL